MAELTPAQQHGMMLGAYKRAFEEFGKQLVEGFRLGYKPPKQLTLDEWETKREFIYRQRITREREVGRSFVTRRANEIREELGLPKA